MLLETAPPGGSLLQPTSSILIPGGRRPPAPPEEARQVPRLERLDEAGLAGGRGAEELELDLGDGGGGGDELVDVLLAARVALEPLEEVADAAVTVGDGGQVGGDTVGALGVDLAAGEGEAAHDLHVAAARGQVDRVVAPAAVGHVHQAAEGAQGLGGGQHALAAAYVQGGVARLEQENKFLA